MHRLVLYRSVCSVAAAISLLHTCLDYQDCGGFWSNGVNKYMRCICWIVMELKEAQVEKVQCPPVIYFQLYPLISSSHTNLTWSFDLIICENLTLEVGTTWGTQEAAAAGETSFVAWWNNWQCWFVKCSTSSSKGGNSSLKNVEVSTFSAGHAEILDSRNSQRDSLQR